MIRLIVKHGKLARSTKQLSPSRAEPADGQARMNRLA
jgi:hypothetical protein